MGISTLLWGYLGGVIVHDLSGADRIWTFFAAILTMLVTHRGLSYHAYRFRDFLRFS